MMTRTLLICVAAVSFGLMMAPAAMAREVGDIEMPEKLSKAGHTLVLNGAGVREKFFIDIYAVGLYLKGKKQNAKSILEADEPMAVRMHIVTNMVTPKKMSDSVNEGFKRSTGGKIAPIKDRKNKMIGVFKSGIKKGDVYDLVYSPATGVSISKNGKVKVTIEGLDFKRALFGIWIGQPPLSSGLKKDLLGK